MIITITTLKRPPLLARKQLPDAVGRVRPVAVRRVDIQRQAGAVVRLRAVGRDGSDLRGRDVGAVGAQQLEAAVAVQREGRATQRDRGRYRLVDLEHGARRLVGAGLDHGGLGWCPWGYAV